MSNKPPNFKKREKIKQETILVTGSSGFIGFSVARKLLDLGFKIVGADNQNDYYDPKLKRDRNKILQKYNDYIFYKGDFSDNKFVLKLFKEQKIDKVCHLAAQAGVRYSIENPAVYIQSNLVGFANLIEEAKNHKVKNFVFASSSSVYGENKKIPFSPEDRVDEPISLYAATKKADELIAYTYNHLFGLNTIGLRFFTVYGPWGRPDMAYFSFTKDILAGKTIKVFNYGKMERDFTYIDDIADGVVSALDKKLGYKILNLGNNKPVKLGYFIECVEKSIGKNAKKKMVPMQLGDVKRTYADIGESKKILGYEPKIGIDEGIEKFVAWYKEYYGK